MQVCEYDRLVKNFDDDIKYFEDYKKKNMSVYNH